MIELTPNQLERMSLIDYFKTIELSIRNPIKLDELTKLFTDEPFLESKPYLNRRVLIPSDKRFNQIEFVYESMDQVRAVVWHFSTSLAQLISIFGSPIIQFEPYSNTSAFTFPSQNRNIEVIKTRHHECLLKNESGGFTYYNIENKKLELKDPEFNFIQFSLKTS